MKFTVTFPIVKVSDLSDAVNVTLPAADDFTKKTACPDVSEVPSTDGPIVTDVAGLACSGTALPDTGLL